MNQNSSGEKVYRVSLTDEQLNWIGSALKSRAKGDRPLDRRMKKLAARLLERHAGNPNLILDGQLEESN